MVIKLIFICVLLAVCGVVNAAEPKATGAYIGGAYGISTFDDDGAFSNLGLTFDDEDTSLQLHGGYKFMKYLAVEARYADFGTFTLGPVGLDITAISIHAVGIIPFGQSGWELFGQLGLGTVTADIAGIEDVDETAVAGGIGLRYSLTQTFSMSVQTDVYVWEDDSLGTVHDLSVGGTQLAIQFIF